MERESEKAYGGIRIRGEGYGSKDIKVEIRATSLSRLFNCIKT